MSGSATPSPPPPEPTYGREPAGQGWKYLSGKQKTLLLCTVSGVLVLGAMWYSGHRRALRDTPPPEKPVVNDNVSEPFRPPPAPISFHLPTPIAPAANLAQVGPGSLAQTTNANDPAKAARESGILLTSSAGASQAAGAASKASQEALDTPAGGGSELQQRLNGTTLTASRAVEMSNPDYTIAQGRVIPCNDQTAVDSSYAGFITATLPYPVFGETGHIKLLDAGSKVFGSMERAMTNGLNRQFVLWNRITTPPLYDSAGNAHQYAIPVNSPAADEVGRTGLDGDVNRHLWQKLGGVLALSLIQGGIRAGVSAAQPSGTSNINLNSFTGGSDQLANTLLQSQINIPDVLTRPQGAACSIFVARDLTFDNIYGVRRH